jgi:hypothetical protein
MMPASAPFFPTIAVRGRLGRHISPFTEFLVTSPEITVMRPVGSKSIPLDQLKSISWPASDPVGLTLGLVRVDGFHRTFGTFWNRN